MGPGYLQFEHGLPLSRESSSAHKRRASIREQPFASSVDNVRWLRENLEGSPMPIGKRQRVMVSRLEVTTVFRAAKSAP